MTLGEDSENNRYIFTDSDFEDDTFHAAQFVARYRRVAPLESLKDQLKSYSLNIKNQLYEIINRDYKNFIKIATKLDGIDVRIEKLRQPIVNIRMDISSLHDLLLTSLKTIQDKLEEKEKIRNRRAVIETCLLCIKKLETAGEILQLSTPGFNKSVSSSDHTSRLHLLGLLNQVTQVNMQKNASKDPKADEQSSLQHGTNFYSSGALSREIFDCSEYERAAFAISTASSRLSKLPNMATVSSGQAALIRQLNQKCELLKDSLVKRVRARLCAMYSDDNRPAARSLAHCLRALVELNRGVEAETAFAETITLPLAKSLLTQGKVDGDGGRGSFAALADTLKSIAAHVRSKQSDIFNVCEDIFTCDIFAECESGSDDDSRSSQSLLVPRDVDIVVNGVWVPVIQLLSEKFPGMFSVGIASTFAKCYLSVNAFATSLSAAVSGDSSGISNSIQLKGNLLRRIYSHEVTREFNNKWRLPLYLQLRVQEISSRVDRLCELSQSLGPTHYTLTLDEVLKTKASTPVKVTAVPVTNITTPSKSVGEIATTSTTPSATPVQKITSLVSATLSTAELESLRSQLKVTTTFSTPLFCTFVMESLVPLHSAVVLRPLGGKLFSLSLRVFARLEGHLASVLGVSTTAFPAAAAAGYSSESQAATSESTNTPMRRVSANVPAQPVANTGGASALLPVEDLMKITLDLCKLISWIATDYSEYCVGSLSLESSQNNGSVSTMVAGCISIQSRRLNELRQTLWMKVCTILVSDCVVALNGVTAVTARYRMTNKPPPQQPSPYVLEILAPLKTFIETHAQSADICSAADSTEQWVAEIVEQVTNQFLLRVQALIETVKSMDAALNKRANKMKPAVTGAAAGASLLSDSEKILLQLYLDVQSYRTLIADVGVNVQNITCLEQLLNAVADGGKFTS